MIYFSIVGIILVTLLVAKIIELCYVYFLNDKIQNFFFATKKDDIINLFKTRTYVQIILPMKYDMVNEAYREYNYNDKTFYNYTCFTNEETMKIINILFDEKIPMTVNDLSINYIYNFFLIRESSSINNTCIMMMQGLSERSKNAIEHMKIMNLI